MTKTKFINQSDKQLLQKYRCVWSKKTKDWVIDYINPPKCDCGCGGYCMSNGAPVIKNKELISLFGTNRKRIYKDYCYKTWKAKPWDIDPTPYYRKIIQDKDWVCDNWNTGCLGFPCATDPNLLPRSCLDVHHKDGNHKNNNRKNLQVLCVCCHRILENGRKNNRSPAEQYKHKMNDKL